MQHSTSIPNQESPTKVDRLRSLYLKGEYGPAEKLAASLVKSKKTAPVATFALGLIKYQTKDFLAALSYFEQALALDKDQVRTGTIHYWLGETYGLSDFPFGTDNPIHDKKKARAAYQKALEYVDYPPETIHKVIDHETPFWQRILYFERGIRDFPDHFLFYIHCSWAYRVENSPIQQREILEKGHMNNPQSTAILFSLAQCLYNNEQYGDCERCILTAIGLHPQQSMDSLYYLTGSAYFAQGDFAEAIAQFVLSIEAEPHSNSIWYPVCGILAAYHRVGYAHKATTYFAGQLLDRRIFEYVDFRYGIGTWLQGERVGETGFLQSKEDVIPPLVQLHKIAKDTEFKVKTAIVLAALYDYFEMYAERYTYLRFALNNSDAVSYLSSALAEAYEERLKTDFEAEELIRDFHEDATKQFSDEQTQTILEVFAGRLHSLSNYKAICSLCDEMDEDDIAQANTLFHYAYALKEDGKAIRAKYFYELELKKHPQSAAALNNLGVIYKEEGELKKAIFLFEEAMKYGQSLDLYKKNLQKATEQLQQKIRSDKTKQIPRQWTDTVTRITVETLEELDYFDVLSRIDRVSSKYKDIIRRDWQELVFNYSVKNHKSTVILSGSFVELLLTYYCEKKRKKVLAIRASNNQTTNKNLYDCVLNDLITFVTDQRWFGNDFSHLGNIARVYRNFIHPGLELKSEGNIKAKAELCFISAKEILHKVL